MCSGNAWSGGKANVEGDTGDGVGLGPECG